MNNQFTIRLILSILMYIFFCILSINLINDMRLSEPKKIDYQLEIINQTDIRLMNEHGETLYITTFDSIGYYIDQDNL